MDKIKNFIKQHPKQVKIAAIYLGVVIVAAILFILFTPSKNNDELNSSNGPKRTDGVDNTNTSVHKDDGNTTNQTGAQIMNYTKLDTCMFPDERNYVTYAINKALLLNKSTHNNQPIDTPYQEPASSTSADEMYPFSDEGEYTEINIDDGQPENVTSYDCTVKLTTNKGRKIKVYFNRYAYEPSTYPQIDVTLDY